MDSTNKTGSKIIDYYDYGIKQELVSGKWKATVEGDLIYDNGKYSIYSYQVKDDNLILHLFSKNWINWNDFIPAYFQALRNLDIQKLNIKVYY